MIINKILNKSKILIKTNSNRIVIGLLKVACSIIVLVVLINLPVKRIIEFFEIINFLELISIVFLKKIKSIIIINKSMNKVMA